MLYFFKNETIAVYICRILQEELRFEQSVFQNILLGPNFSPIYLAFNSSSPLEIVQ